MTVPALVALLASLALSQAPEPAQAPAPAPASAPAPNDPEVDRWEAAVAAQPDSAAAHYNLGVARYRAGQFKEAADSFKRAGEVASGADSPDPALAASSAYNRAASFYGSTREQAEAAQRMLEAKEREGAAEGAGAPIDPEALKQAIADATASFDGFRDAAYADPSDLGSRANAEQSRRLIRALEELQRQQQQQQQQQNEKQQPQDQQDAKDQEQPQDGEQPKPQDAPSEERPQDQEGKDGGADDEKEREAQQQQQQGQPRQDPPADRPQELEAAKQQPAKPGEMTKEEADRLLQGVRDRERRRRAEQDRRAQEQATRGRAPVKDW
jgi:colicin import membrane protein